MFGGFLIARPPTFVVNSKYVLTPNGEKVCVFETKTGEIVTTLDGHSSMIASICAFNGNESSNEKDSHMPQAVTATIDGTIRVWNVVSGRMLQAHKLDLEDGHILVSVTPLRWTDALNTGFVVMTNRPSGNGSASIESCMYISTFYMDGSALSVRTNIIRRFAETSLKHVAVSATGKLVAAVTDNHLFVYLNAANRWLSVHSNVPLTHVAVHPQDESVVVSDQRGALQVFHQLAAQPHLFDESLDLEKSDLNVTVLQGGAQATPPVPSMYHWHSSAVRGVAFSPSGYLLTAGSEGVLVLWQVALGRSQYLPRLGAPVEHVAVNEEGTRAALSLADNSVCLVDLTGPRVVRVIRGVEANFKAARSGVATRKDAHSFALRSCVGGEDWVGRTLAFEKLVNAPLPSVLAPNQIEQIERRLDASSAVSALPSAGETFNARLVASAGGCTALLAPFPGFDTEIPVDSEDENTEETAEEDREVAMASNASALKRRQRALHMAKLQAQADAGPASAGKMAAQLKGSSLHAAAEECVALVTAGSQAHIWSLVSQSQIATLPVAGATLGGAASQFVSSTQKGNHTTEWSVERFLFTKAAEGTLLITAESRPAVLPELRTGFVSGNRRGGAALGDQVNAHATGSQHCLKIFLVEDKTIHTIKEHQKKPTKKTRASLAAIRAGIVRPDMTLSLLARIEHSHDNAVTALLPGAQTGSFWSVSADSRAKLWSRVCETVEIPLSPAEVKQAKAEGKANAAELTKQEVRVTWAQTSVVSYASKPCLAASLSRDGSLMAIAHDNVVSVWRPQAAQLLTTLVLPGTSETQIRAAIILETPRGAAIVAATKRQLVSWNLLTGSPDWVFPMEAKAELETILAVPATYGATVSFVAVVNKPAQVQCFGLTGEGSPVSLGTLSRGFVGSDRCAIVTACLLPPLMSAKAAQESHVSAVELAAPRLVSLTSDLALKVTPLVPSTLTAEGALAADQASLKVKSVDEKKSAASASAEDVQLVKTAAPTSVPAPLAASAYLDACRGVSLLDARVDVISRVHPADAPSFLAPPPATICRALLRASTVPRPPLAASNFGAGLDRNASTSTQTNGLIGGGIWSQEDSVMKTILAKAAAAKVESKSVDEAALERLASNLKL